MSSMPPVRRSIPLPEAGAGAPSAAGSAAGGASGACANADVTEASGVRAQRIARAQMGKRMVEFAFGDFARHAYTLASASLGARVVLEATPGFVNDLEPIPAP